MQMTPALRVLLRSDESATPGIADRPVTSAWTRLRELLSATTSSPQRILTLFLVIWFTAGVLQSIFTSLWPEEAYYAMFGQNLAWGYFDHPPAVALCARLGMLFFSGNLGPRIVIVILSTATLWIGSRLVERRHIPLYILTVSAVGLVQAGSFFLKTDVPLLFFATVFFYYYREYVEGRRRVAVWILPLAIAGMLLSKYHGILVVAFTVASNPGMLRRASFWWIVALSLVLLLPHAAWEYAHDFVTVRYHLSGRADAGSSWGDVFGYILSQPLVFGPAVGVLLLPAALMAGARNRVDKAMQYNLVGVLAFFFVSSFHLSIHKHWTSIALIPVLCLGLRRIGQIPALQRALVRVAVATIAIFIPVRVYLAWDFLPRSVAQHLEIVHGWQQWAQEVHQLADGRRVVFLSDAGDAGLYSYYTSEMAHSYNSPGFQNSQQDLWPIEQSFRGMPAMIVAGRMREGYTQVIAGNGAEIRYRFVDDLQTYSKVELRLAGGPPADCQAGAAVPLKLSLINHYEQPIAFKPHVELAPVITYQFLKGRKIVADGVCDTSLAGTTLQKETELPVVVQSPTAPGDYTLRFAIQPGWLPPSSGGTPCRISIRPPSRSFAIAK